MMRTALVAALVVSFVCSHSGIVRAQSDSQRREASEHFERGIERFNEGDFEAALAEFQRAYEVVPAHPVLYNLGRVHAELGHPVDAARALERFLDEGGISISVARRREVETLLAAQRARIGAVHVETNVQGSVVSVDGVDAATTPLGEPISVSAGAHTVGVRAPGYESVTRAVRVAGGVEERFVVELRREVEALGTLRIRSPLRDVRVTIDGSEVGHTPLTATIPVSAGAHTVRGERRGYQADEATVTVADRAEVEVRLSPTADPEIAAESALELRVPDVAYSLRIDGVERTPSRRISLPEGFHEIQLDAADREPYRGVVRTSGPLTVVAPPLTWTPSARHARLASAREQRTAGIAMSIAFGLLTVASVPVLAWNESEIASTDRRIRELSSEYEAINCRMAGGSEPCTRITDEITPLEQRQPTQDVLRISSIAALSVGVAFEALGLLLWLTAPTEEEIDQGAHASLRLNPMGLVLEGTF